MMRTAVTLIAFGVRHFLAVCLAMAVGCVVWTVAYCLLLIYAICFNEGVGGPLAYPAGLLAILITCSVLGWGVFAPAAGLGRIFCRLTGFPGLTAIPIVFASAFGLTYLVALVFFMGFSNESPPSFWLILVNFGLFLSIPLGVYWWLTEGPGALIDAIRRLVATRREPTPAKPVSIQLK